jgi:NAD(P)H dehydrogenase (quinone)
MKEILILYFSKYGATELLAREIANGVDSVEGVSSKIRTVPSIPISNKKNDNIPDQGPPYIEKQDLFDCDGLILGSPCRFGNMAAELKYFLDNTINEWLNNALSEKPAGVFTSSGSMHGGQESTLLTMAIPLLHHGMLLTGIPFSEKGLSTTREGGTPYGPSHVSDETAQKSLSPDEVSLARALGKRISKIAKQLNQTD